MATLYAAFLGLMTAELHGGLMPVQRAPLGPTRGEERHAIVGSLRATQRHAATTTTWRAEAARRGDKLSVVLTDGDRECQEWAGPATAEWVESAAALIVQAMAARWSEAAAYPWSCGRPCCSSASGPVRRCSGLVGAESQVFDSLFTMCLYRLAGVAWGLDHATGGVPVRDRRRWQLEVARQVFDRPGTTVVVRAHGRVGVQELSQALLEMVNGRPTLHEQPRSLPRFGWPVAQLVKGGTGAVAAARTAGLVIVDAGGATDAAATDAAVEVLRARRRATSVLVLANGDVALDALCVGLTDVVVVDVTTAGAASNVHHPSPASPANWVIEF